MPRSKKRRPRNGTSPPPVSLKSAQKSFQRGDLAKTVKQCRAILSQDSDNGEALNLLGGACLMSGNTGDAIEVLSRVASLKPGDPATQSNLGAALAAARRFEEAESCFAKALARTPGDLDIRLNLGRAQRELGRHSEALRTLTEALAAAPDSVDILVEAARASLGDHDAASAELYLRKALALAPHSLPVLKDLVRVLYESGRYSECLVSADAALALDTKNPALHVDRGLVLSRLERYDDALASFDAALARDPDNADATFGRALVNLLQGRFSTAWPDYRARQSMRAPASPSSLAACGSGYHHAPLPADLSGRRILVVNDQGLGDELFFLRFAGRLRQRGAQVAYLPDRRLAAMLRRADVVDEIVTDTGANDRFDYRLSVSDLPWLTDAGSDGTVAPSIAIPPLSDRTKAVAADLADFGKPPYTGVTWRAGSAGDSKILYKEIPIDALAQAMARVEGSIIILQRNPADGEVAAFARAAGRPVLDLSDLNSDLEAMLSLCSLLDLYVAVSNTNVHLREACGRPSHVIVPYPPEFRWMAMGEESLWFPGTRLYRQRPDGDWGPAIDALAADLGPSAPAARAAG